MEVKISSRLLTQLLEGAQHPSETKAEKEASTLCGKYSQKRRKPIALSNPRKRFHLQDFVDDNSNVAKPTDADFVYQWMILHLRTFDVSMLPHLGRTFTCQYAECLKAVWCVMRLSLELLATDRFQKYNVYLYLADESRMIRFCRWRDFEVVMDLCGSTDASPGMHCFQIPMIQPDLSSFTLRACALLHEVANYPSAWKWRVHNGECRKPVLTYDLRDFVTRFTHHQLPHTI